MSQLNFSTKALRTGATPEINRASIQTPIFQTVSYVFESTDHAASVFNLSVATPIYTRLNNPTNGVLEQRLATLEGGIAAVVTASGQAALATTFLTILQSGDHLVSSSSIYGGSYNLLNHTLRKFGIHTTFVDSDDPSNYLSAIRPNTKAIFIESVGNPKLDVLDIEAIAHIANKNNIPLIVDNTLATPYLLNPIQHGANVVIHSITKYISGNGSSLGGAIIDGGNFDWANGKFPAFSQPSDGYHGLVFTDHFGKAALTGKLVAEGLRDFGSALSPFNAFQILQGLETLSLRIRKQSDNALAIAKWLEVQDEVAWVNYPGLESSEYHDLAKKYLPEGQSGIVTFGPKGGYEAAKTIADSTQLFTLMANFGDSKSLIIHPASTTHQQLSDEEQEQSGVSPDLIRLSIGLEDIEDLKQDLKAALKQANQLALVG